MQDAIVIAAEVAPGEGILAGEPVTTATVRRFSDGRERSVRLVGGPTAAGGRARLAGHVVPVVGRRVRFDLREEVSPPLSLPENHWLPNTPPGPWDASKLPLTFILALPPSRDLGSEAAGELEVAMRTWERPACTAFHARFDGVRNALPGDDGENGVFFHDAEWPDALEPGALAQTVLHEDEAGKLRDADLHINSAEFRFSSTAAVGTQDIRGVLVHELGHALGLGHSTDPRATMNISGSGLRWRSLENDDILGVCTLYPGTGGASCDAAPCPDGFLCVAGACQRPGERADVCSPCSPELDACEAAGDGARCVEIGFGDASGRVCGRACVRDEDCGSGFACRPTTEAGDLQCVSLDGCRNGASPCVVDADCSKLQAVCRAGACVGARDLPLRDAGPNDGSSDERPVPVREGGNRCACRAHSTPSNSSSSAALAVLGATLWALRRAQRRDLRDGASS